MKLSEKDIIILAAMFARSNMGMERASDNRVRRLKDCKFLHLEDAVSDLCQEFMENDEHYDIFVEEAQGWVDYLKNEPRASEIHKDLFEQYKRIS
jgi:hypothetical protein